ncbi:hypothetical protein CVO96_19280 [Deinococcus koreensis]|uniref:Bacterial transcriptional activator domain-containing protein n=1 Tax=Deinococcus koreensis TaxID=2054903 RepID=A0A2K3USR8_9DEIO|nr:hypothetical protein CVO96_19280 [Deinococcus koreensis]
MRTLGHQQVVLAGRAVSWPSQAARDLFFLLLSDPRGHTRSDLIDLLWGESETRDGSNNLKVTRYRLRQALGDPDAILEQDGRQVLAPRYHEYADHTRFQRLLTQARGADDRERQLSYTYQALSLYEGEYLPDQTAPWADDMRNTLRTVYVRARLELASRHCDAVECQAAVQNLAGALRADPLVGEQYHRNLMGCLGTLGRADQAITHFRHFLTFIQRDVGDTLAQGTLTLADQLKSGEVHSVQHIGSDLPCPRRILHGRPQVDQRHRPPFDLSHWETELLRGRQVLSLMQKLSRVHSWPLLARLVQEFLAARLPTPYVCLLPHDVNPQRSLLPGTGPVAGWPTAVLSAVQAELDRVTGQGTARSGGAYPAHEPDSRRPVLIHTVHDPAAQPLGWLCVARASEGADLSSGDTELLARVAEALCYLLSQPHWTPRPSPKRPN